MPTKTEIPALTDPSAPLRLKGSERMEEGKSANYRVAFISVCLPDLQITNDEQHTGRSFHLALLSLPVMTVCWQLAQMAHVWVPVSDSE